MIISQITGFSGLAPIKIYDGKNRIFYNKNRSNNRDGIVYFNLPPGRYFTDNELKRLPRPIKYKCPLLPKPERLLNIPQLKIIVEKNPRKCSIYFATGIIKIDPEYAAKPLPQLMHILFHEIGHFLYATEYKCDLFSCYNMLKYGFNPSQCLKVMLHNLSSNKQESLKRSVINAHYLKSVKIT